MESLRGEQIRNAIDGLSAADRVRLNLMARSLDHRRHDDLLQEAIAKTLSRDRTWRNGMELFWHLYHAMKSIARNWAKKADENLVFESQLGNVGEPSFLSQLAADTPNPERQAAARLAVKRILTACEADPVVVALLTSKLLGKTESEIRDELGLTECDFHAAAQRLRRLGKKVLGLKRYA